MRTLTSDFFEVKIRHNAVQENGTPCKINELFVADACSFSECEEKATKYIEPYANGEFEVLTEVRAAYREILFSDVPNEDKYYKCRVAFLVTDDNGKLRKSKVTYLVQGDTIDTAKKNLDEVMSQGMSQFTVEGIHETAIMDIVC